LLEFDPPKLPGVMLYYSSLYTTAQHSGTSFYQIIFEQPFSARFVLKFGFFEKFGCATFILLCLQQLG
jgi:hypothetical protein